MARHRHVHERNTLVVDEKHRLAALSRAGRTTIREIEARFDPLGPEAKIFRRGLLTALGYVACSKGISVRFTRAIGMINALTAAQVNGTLGKALEAYTNPSPLLLDELGYLPVDKRGADLMFWPSPAAPLKEEGREF